MKSIEYFWKPYICPKASRKIICLIWPQLLLIQTKNLCPESEVSTYLHTPLAKTFPTHPLFHTACSVSLAWETVCPFTAFTLLPRLIFVLFHSFTSELFSGWLKSPKWSNIPYIHREVPLFKKSQKFQKFQTSSTTLVNPPIHGGGKLFPKIAKYPTYTHSPGQGGPPRPNLPETWAVHPFHPSRLDDGKHRMIS